MSGINTKMSAAIFAMLVIVGVVTGVFGAGKDNPDADICVAQAETTLQDGSSCVAVIQTETISEHVDVLMDSVKLDMKGASMTSEKTQGQETETEPETQTEAETEAVKASPVISLSDDDYNNLLRIVEAEATGGDVMSKILVANVIINRVMSAAFPGTVTEVICQGNGEQFQPIMDGRFYSVNVTAGTVEAVDRALYGEDYSQGATFFAAVGSAGPTSWHSVNLNRLFEYGGHVYFAPY